MEITFERKTPRSHRFLPPFRPEQMMQRGVIWPAPSTGKPGRRSSQVSRARGRFERLGPRYRERMHLPDLGLIYNPQPITDYRESLSYRLPRLTAGAARGATPL